MAAAWRAGWDILVAKTHTQQAIWWLNGFWKEGADAEAERLWEITHLALEVDTGQKKLYGKRRVEVKESCDLDELKAHVFLEKLGETLTVRALRARLKELDIDNNNRMALSEYLLAHYKKTPLALVNSPQGEANEAELAAAQEQLNLATEALGQAIEQKSAADKALIAAQLAEKNAQEAKVAAAKSLADMEKAEAALKAAEAELRVAVDALNAEEKAFQDKIATLEGQANDPNLGAVKKNKAVNELAQLRSEDPLPLRKAKITQEAALKRAEKARAPFAEATARAAAEKKKADDAAVAAAQALAASQQAARDLAAKVEEAKQLFADAERSLAEIKAKGDGVAYGALWWMEREMKEQQKFMPSR